MLPNQPIRRSHSSDYATASKPRSQHAGAYFQSTDEEYIPIPPQRSTVSSVTTNGIIISEGPSMRASTAAQSVLHEQRLAAAQRFRGGNAPESHASHISVPIRRSTSAGSAAPSDATRRQFDPAANGNMRELQDVGISLPASVYSPSSSASSKHGHERRPLRTAAESTGELDDQGDSRMAESDVLRSLACGEHVVITGDMEGYILDTLTKHALSHRGHVQVQLEGGQVVKLGLDSREVMEHLVKLTKSRKEGARWTVMLQSKSAAGVGSLHSDIKSLQPHKVPEMPALSPREEARLLVMRKRATAALTRIFPASQYARKFGCKAGVQSSLMDMMTSAASDSSLKCLAVACLASLCADSKIKDSVGKANAIPFIASLLEPVPLENADSVTTISQAADCLWRLVVDHTDNKLLFGRPIVDKLLSVCEMNGTQFVYANKMACGCIAELCLGGIKEVKDVVRQAGAIDRIAPLIRNADADLHRLAALALCNLISNFPDAKKEARRAGLFGQLCCLLRATTSPEAQQTAAGGIFNLAEPKDLDEIMAYDVLETLVKIPVSSQIMIKLRLPQSRSGSQQSGSEYQGSRFDAVGHKQQQEVHLHTAGSSSQQGSARDKRYDDSDSDCEFTSDLSAISGHLMNLSCENNKGADGRRGISRMPGGGSIGIA